jgi:serine/threonine-protein kinase
MKRCPTCHRTFVDGQPDCPLDRAQLVPCAGTPPPELGRELGSYRLIGLLGTGGMGNIYIAAHAKLNRHVAIKVLRPELAKRKELVARFFAEARTVNQLRHPNIVESIDMVEDVDNGAYTVLELLRGPDIKTRLAAGPIAIESAIRIGAQVADALAAVHAHGIVHRDLKPENLILIERDGRDDFVKLIDFGVAQIGEDSATGQPFGTAAFMAPEQAAGKRVDGRADLYALGVLLFEMVTGQHPFPSTSDHEYVLRHADESPARPDVIAPRCPRALATVILRCLAKRPEDRFPDATAVATALRGIDPHARQPRRGTWLAAGIAVAAVVAGGAVLVLPRLLGASAPANAAPATTPAPVPRPAPATPGPAGSATPDEPPAPGAATVSISITSIPPGATVHRAGETVPLGTTPFTATLLRSGRREHLRFDLAGYDPHPLDITVDDSHEITVTMVPHRTTAAVTAPPTKTTPKKVQREGTIDPFAP